MLRLGFSAASPAWPKRRPSRLVPRPRGRRTARFASPPKHPGTPAPQLVRPAQLSLLAMAPCTRADPGPSPSGHLPVARASTTPPAHARCCARHATPHEAAPPSLPAPAHRPTKPWPRRLPRAHRPEPENPHPVGPACGPAAWAAFQGSQPAGRASTLTLAAPPRAWPSGIVTPPTGQRPETAQGRWELVTLSKTKPRRQHQSSGPRFLAEAQAPRLARGSFRCSPSTRRSWPAGKGELRQSGWPRTASVRPFRRWLQGLATKEPQFPGENNFNDGAAEPEQP